jgi:asparagine synthase (glutamine-hydrolysing)
MIQCLTHRGPDDSGTWFDEVAGVAFGQRRLAIQDLSSAGHQPMVSHSGRFVLVLNGEIYNHLELRAELQSAGINHPWRGHSDTETLLVLIEVHGLHAALEKCVGMFAIALWDREQRKLFLARDRAGEKPMYFGFVSGALLFGSELKALRAVAGESLRIDRSALTLFMRHNYIPAPLSIYERVFKLSPGSIAEFNRPDADASISTFWSAREIAERGLRQPFTGSDTEAIQQVEKVLMRAVSSQLISDVPLGAFLSGGIDSTLIVALMQAQGRGRAKTFTIGFNEEQYDEAPYARAVANHLGTEHTEYYVTAAEARNVVPDLPAIFDEPFADSSQIPTVLVSRLARRHVTVSLSGDAGDELFGGYSRYLWTRRIWKNIAWIPQGARRTFARMFERRGSVVSAHDVAGARAVRPPRLARLREKLAKVAELVGAQDAREIYYGLVSHWKDPASVVIGGSEPPTKVSDPKQWLGGAELEHHMMFLDLLTYLPDDILVKVDRAAMSTSLESRVPFLDHRVIEFAWTLPMRFKIRDGSSKWILRQLLQKYVPRSMFERPKTGFGIPIDYWLRGPLKEWAADLLASHRLRDEGFFNPEPIEKKWNEHRAGTRNWGYYLWDVLMFQSWLDSTRKQ